MTKVGIARVDPYPLLTARAKAMRKTMTPAERKLWNALRQRLLINKTHFRRQVRLGTFIADFCCLGLKLIVEVDGNQHGSDSQRDYDARRTAFLQAKGFRVLRFSNETVFREIEAVLDTISAAAGVLDIELKPTDLAMEAPRAELAR